MTTLREQLRQELSSQKHRKALPLAKGLEALDPDDGQWPQRIGDIYFRLDEQELMLDALARAAQAFERSGIVIKATAICKRILEVEPGHTVASSILDRVAIQHSRHETHDPPVQTMTLRSGKPLESIELGQVSPSTPWIGDSDITATEITIDTESEIDAESLARTPLFSSLDSNALRCVINEARLVRLEPGETLFHQGERAETMYVVADGQVEAWAEGDPPKPLAVFHEGEFFGETALITDQRRNAMAYSDSGAMLLEFTRTLVSTLISQNADSLSVLLRFMRARLVDHLFETRAVLSGIPKSERSKLTRKFKFLEVKPGQVLTKRDTPSQALFVLLAGEVDVNSHEDGKDHVLATLGAGDVFGEMALLNGKARTACTIARTKCWLLALPRAEAVTAMACYPTLRENIELMAAERSRSNELFFLESSLGVV